MNAERSAQFAQCNKEVLGFLSAVIQRMMPPSTWAGLHLIQEFTASASQNAKLLGQSRFVHQALQSVGQEPADFQDRLHAMVAVFQVVRIEQNPSIFQEGYDSLRDVTLTRGAPIGLRRLSAPPLR